MFTNLSGSKIVWPITKESSSQMVASGNKQWTKSQHSLFRSAYVIHHKRKWHQSNELPETKYHKLREVQPQNIKELIYLQCVCSKFQ